jgi:hypothetical protein
MNSPLVMLLVVLAVLGLKVWLAFRVEKWARSKGRTGRWWFLCALLWLIPTAIVLALLPTKPLITMQHSSRHQIDLSAPEAS